MTQFPRRDLPPLHHQSVRALLVRQAVAGTGPHRPLARRVSIPAAALAVTVAMAAGAFVARSLTASDRDPAAATASAAVGRTAAVTATADALGAAAGASAAAGPTAATASLPAPSRGSPAGVAALIPADGSLLTRSMSYAGTGRLLALASDSATIRLYDTTNPADPVRLAAVNGRSDWTTSVALNPDGTVLATSGADGTIRIWDVAQPRSPRLSQTIPASTQYVPDLTFSPDGRTLATAGYDDKVTLWNVRGSSLTRRSVLAEGSSDIMAVAFDPSGKRLAAASYEKVSLWDLTANGSPRVASSVKVHENGLIDVAFSPDGKTLVTADGTVTLWNVSSLAKPRSMVKLPAAGASVAYDPARSIAATMNAKGQVQLWDVSRPSRPVATATYSLKAPGTADDRGLAFSADGLMLAASRSNGGAAVITVP